MQNINIFLLIFMDFMNKKHTPYNYINNIIIYDYYYKILWYKNFFRGIASNLGINNCRNIYIS